MHNIRQLQLGTPQLSSRGKSRAATLGGLFPITMFSKLWRARALRVGSTCLLAITCATSGACVGRHALAARNTDGLGSGVAWFAPSDAADARTLDNWRASVGPPVFAAAPGQPASRVDTLTLVSWNTALGAGDVERLVSDVRRRVPAAPIVLLL